MCAFKPYTGDPVPVSWLSAKTPNCFSRDAVHGSAPDSEAPLIDVENSINLDVRKMFDQSLVSDGLNSQQNSIPQRCVDETKIKQLLQDGFDHIVVNEVDRTVS